MPLVNSQTGKVRKDYSLEELKQAAREMRGYNLVSLTAAGSGHSGGTLSVMDLTAALYLKVARLDPKNPFWPGRDRIIWSTGHKAPALYVALGMAGFYDVAESVKLRKLYSPFQGHPHWLKLDGVEVSTGSLGQGLSIAVGIACAARLDKQDYRVYSLNGDGELQEGQIWEAIMEAGNFGLDNVCCLVDKNRLQIDGWVKDVQDIDPLREKFESFKWHVVECDGHDMAQILEAFEKAATLKGKPTAIIANTVKGKGISFMENIAGWHGRSPSLEELKKAIAELGLDWEGFQVPALLQRAQDYQTEAEAQLQKKVPRFKRDYFWNRLPLMKVEMAPTRLGFGKALAERGDDERIVCIGGDISASITISQFFDKHPERKARWISAGIAEQSSTALAAGLAKEGKLPVYGNYGVFSVGRNLDQIRTTICYGNLNVFIAGAHGGVSVGPDGATHQSLEDLFQICGLPNMHVSVPCDVLETQRATEHMLFQVNGPKYIRFAREATPIVTKPDFPYQWGVANIYRYRGEKELFLDAFSVSLAADYISENEEITIIACGPEVPEAMRAAWILKEDFGLETRIINMHTLKPLDRRAILRAGLETGIVVTAEEHQVGALGNSVAGILMQSRELYGKPIRLGMIGVQDRFGESGAPWELMWEFEVSGEHIAQKAKELYDSVKKI
jgi:transketolase